MSKISEYARLKQAKYTLKISESTHKRTGYIFMILKRAKYGSEIRDTDPIRPRHLPSIF